MQCLIVQSIGLKIYVERRDYLNRKTTKHKTSNTDLSHSHDIEIYGITYTVVSHFSDKSDETAEDKIARLIKRDIKAS